MAAVAPPLCDAARRIGGRRLQVETLEHSALAREFEHAGFLRRDDIVPVFARSFTPEGAAAMRDAASWELTSLDMER